MSLNRWIGAQVLALGAAFVVPIGAALAQTEGSQGRMPIRPECQRMTHREACTCALNEAGGWIRPDGGWRYEGVGASRTQALCMQRNFPDVP